MALILAGPKAVPPPAVGPQWAGVTSMTWTVPGVASVDLLDWRADGVMVLRDGLRGLNMPPVERFTSTSPAVAGSRWRGAQTRERSVFWPTLVYTDAGSDVWHEADERLWSTLRPDLVGEWAVVTDRGGERRLRCRWVGDGDHSFPRDPIQAGWAIYGVELVAEDPYWAGETVVSTWEAGGSAGEPFLPGPPFHIAAASTTDAARLVNPGELPAHVVWTVTGPCTSAQVGFEVDTDTPDGPTRSVVKVPWPLADGETVTIDTRPNMQTAVATSAAGAVTDRTGDLGEEAAFAPIPPGDGATLQLAVDGGGTITAELEPMYWRAF